VLQHATHVYLHAEKRTVYAYHTVTATMSISYLAPEQLERDAAGNILFRRRVTHVKRLPSEPFDGAKADCYAYSVLVARLHYGRAVSLETKQEQRIFCSR